MLAVHNAGSNNISELARLLIDGGTDVNQGDGYGMTALMCASISIVLKQH